MPVRLPIDEILDDVVSTLLDPTSRCLVIEAPPGAGKTTRLPPALLETCPEAQIFVTEPRRVAARLAARRVADERGERLGEQVGYQVRFDDCTSAATRLTYMTEGLLLRRLFDTPSSLERSIVFLDEVHERSADLDVLLALLKRRLDDGLDFKLVAMSATLDGERLQSFLGPTTQRIRSEGRAYPVAVSYAPKPDDRPLPIRVRSAVKEARRRPGDILVFLPGAAEIRACQHALEQIDGLAVQCMHGDMPLSQQVEVVRPQSTGQRVVLSTNIAESSLTIPGVTTVIDSGLARTSEFDPWAAVARLRTVPISQARAMQRAGRAGRIEPGHAIRLYTQGEFKTREQQDTVELLRSDLSAVLLDLLVVEDSGGPSLAQLSFLSPPPAVAWEQARQLLKVLGAVDEDGLTDLGRRMSQFALPPRLARCVVEGTRRGLPARSCIAAALLSERDLVVDSKTSAEFGQVEATDSDLDDRIDRLSQLAASGFDRRLAAELRVDINRARLVDRAASSLYERARRLFDFAPASSALRHPGEDIHEQSEDEYGLDSITRAFLPGFADRVAQRRGTGRDVIMMTGQQATLSPSSGVQSSWLLAMSMDAPGGRSSKPVVRLAAQIDPEWLFDLDTEELVASDEPIFSEDKQRVELLSRIAYGKLTLDESSAVAKPCESTSRLLTAALLAHGRAVYDPDDEIAHLQVRLGLFISHRAELVEKLTDAERTFLVRLAEEERVIDEHLLAILSRDATNLTDILDIPLEGALRELLPEPVVLALARDLPSRLRLRGGLEVEIHYETGRPPWIEARLQNFFSMSETPTICSGRLALQVHLLAPNHRAVQVTTDLSGFWERHYPSLRKELMRRYPKHLWPEDGRSANPPAPGRIR